MIKNTLIILIAVIWSYCFSQDSMKINIDEQGISSLPADIIFFEINITEDNIDANEAFTNHKSKVKVLSNILNEINLPDSVIHFSLFKINKPGSRIDREKIYRTNQKISLVLSEYDYYNQLQIKLISNGFDNFSASFKSSNSEHGFELAIVNAMKKVRNQFDTLIKDLHKKSYKITRIDVKRKVSQLRETFEFFSATKTAIRTFEKIPQTIHFEVEIEVEALVM